MSLKDEKELIRRALRERTAPGIVGVAIDSVRYKLLVFGSRDKQADAEATLRRLLGLPALDRVELHPRDLRTGPAQPVSQEKSREVGWRRT